MYKYLSHILTADTPRYGNQGPLELRRVRKMCCGDQSNNTELEFSAHLGTHIDAPFHFDTKGLQLETYPASFWKCRKIALIDYSAAKDEVLSLETMNEQLESVPQDSDLLLIRTGWENLRASGTDSEYIFHGPGIGPDIGHWLRENRNLKMIGFDFISLTGFANRELGRVAHRAFLSNRDETGEAVKKAPILIIEDMKLGELVKAPREVWVSPLRYEKGDGAPVTVIAS
jgi:kynurenine formamidase